ncbi:cytochrome c-type biogenesis protein [Bartonella sp. B41]
MVFFRILLFVVFFFPMTLVVESGEVLQDIVLESRVQDIASYLRCLVCQNQSISDSDSAFAYDLRLLIREKLKIGYSNQQVIDFFVEKYGEFILLKPQFNKTTWFLWLSPLIIMSIGIGIIFLQIRRYGDKKSPFET